MELVQLIVQKKWNGRKRSETWSGQNLSNPHFLKKKHFRAMPFFFWRSKGVQGETVGNSRRSHLRSAKKTCFYTIFKHFSWTYATKQLFSERLIGPIPFVEGWSSANPCKPWRLSFFVRPLCAYTAPNIASWPWYPIFPKNHKIPGAREI